MELKGVRAELKGVARRVGIETEGAGRRERRREEKVLKERRSRRRRGRMGTSQREENGRALNFPPHMHCPRRPGAGRVPRPWIMKFLIER